MYLKFTKEDNIQEIYHLLIGGICPRPIAWISSLSSTGVANLAPYSFFTVASCNPPVLSITQINPRDRLAKDTLINLQETGECVVNIVSGGQVDAMNATCADYSHDVSEFAMAAVKQVASVSVSPPGVMDSTIRYECRLRDILSISDLPSGGKLMLLDVIGIHVDDRIFINGAINPQLIDTVGKMGGDHYSYTREQFELARPLLKQ
ncbi:MAG: hypothetical protein RI964_1458 [Pseudomonadota bacterium]|jgi:flavin reductase (DIM6/NTAB) family NADH-FMN oxidoreductase RutF